MINIPLEKLLFIDIETVGIQPDWDHLVDTNEALSFQFQNYFDWFQKRFPEDDGKSCLDFRFVLFGELTVAIRLLFLFSFYFLILLKIIKLKFILVGIA